MLFAAMPGAGLVAVDLTDAAFAGVPPSPPANSSWKSAIQFQSCLQGVDCGAATVDNGVCVTDITYVGGYLYATVGNALTNPNANITHCNKAVKSGLYRGKISVMPTAQNKAKLQLVPAPGNPATNFYDPRAVVVTVAANNKPFIVVADWAVPTPVAPAATNKCAAGLWRGVLTTAADGTISVAWAYIARQEKISAMTWLDAKSLILAFVVTNDQRQQVAELSGGDYIWPDPVSIVNNSKLFELVHHLTPSRAGAYVINAGTVVGKANAAYPATDCAAQPAAWNLSLQGVAACDENDLKCVPIGAAKLGNSSGGLPSAGSTLSTVAADQEKGVGDLAVGTAGGQGAWWITAGELVKIAKIAAMLVDAQKFGLGPLGPDWLNTGNWLDNAWRWNFADGYWKQDPAIATPAWIDSQLGAIRDAGLWYSIGVSRSQAADAATNGMGNATDNFAFFSQQDLPGPVIERAQNATDNTFTLDAKAFGSKGNAQVSRARLALNQAVAAGGSMTLNGQKLIAVPEGDDLTH